jgi:hypothetical protein
MSTDELKRLCAIAERIRHLDVTDELYNCTALLVAAVLAYRARPTRPTNLDQLDAETLAEANLEAALKPFLDD